MDPEALCADIRSAPDGTGVAITTRRGLLDVSPTDILEHFLDRGRRRVELQISVTRLLAASIALIWELSLSPRSSLHVPHDAFVMRVIVFSVGVVGSLGFILHLRSKAPGCSMHRIGLLATAFDLTLAVAATLPNTMWPTEGTPGYASNLSHAIVFIATIASGMRMSIGAASLGVILATIGVTGAITLDHVFMHHPLSHPHELAAALTVFLASCLLAIFLARRSKLLLREGVAFMAAASQARAAAEGTLGAYLSPEVAAQALAGKAPAPGGVRRPVAILFSDLRGFTAYGESLSPERLLAELNAYLEAVVPAITAHGGTIDKFMGDGIMVVFGATEAQPDAALRAVRTAIAMGDALALHNEDRAARDRPPLEHGIGVHWGNAIVGNVGTKERLDHTAIGDVVNTASRLQTETKRIGVQILISGAAVKAARAAAPDGRAPLCASRGRLRVRGRSEALDVYTPVAPSLAALVSGTTPHPDNLPSLGESPIGEGTPQPGPRPLAPTRAEKAAASQPMPVVAFSGSIARLRRPPD